MTLPCQCSRGNGKTRHALGWLDRNPVAMVRISSKRLWRPDVLTAEEFRSLLEALPERERLMSTICAISGLRIGEVLGLKWEDINFTTRMADVLRSCSEGAIGPCKTEVSEQRRAVDLLLGRKPRNPSNERAEMEFVPILFP